MSSTPPGVSLRTLQRDSTRRTLVHAAGVCFLHRGLAATTVEEIARAAGTTRATFYLHFKGKADVVATLVESVRHDTDELHAELEAAVASGRKEELSAWLERAFDFWERAGSFVRIEEEAATLYPDVQAGRERAFELGVAALERGLQSAGVADQAGRRARAVLAYLQLQTLFNRWVRLGWEVGREEFLEAMTDMWMAAFTR